jgi:hypothetical protein
MPLLTGSWRAFVGGAEGTLTIDSIDQNGRVAGELIVPGLPQPEETQQIAGLWEEAASALTFFWLRGSVVFTAYHFQFPSSVQEGRDVTHTLTGHFVVAPGTAGLPVNPTARRHHFGWFAQITQVV